MGREGLVRELRKRVEGDGHLTLLITQYGSHLYGTNTPDSDLDYYGLFLPNPKDLLVGKPIKSYRFQTNPGGQRNTRDDVDATFVDVRKVLKNFVKGEINAMDLLFAHRNKDAVIYTHSLYEQVVVPAVESGQLAICDYHGVLGYVWGQVTKYGMKGTRLGEALELKKALEGLDPNVPLAKVMWQLPTGDHVRTTLVSLTIEGGELATGVGLEVLGKKLMPYETVGQALEKVDRWISKYGNRAELARRNEGVDWKAVSHAYRALVQAELYHNLGHVPLPLPEHERELIIDLKRGLVPFEKAEELIVEKLNRVRGFEYECNPKEVDRLILELYRVWISDRGWCED